MGDNVEIVSGHDTRTTWLFFTTNTWYFLLVRFYLVLPTRNTMVQQATIAGSPFEKVCPRPHCGCVYITSKVRMCRIWRAQNDVRMKTEGDTDAPASDTKVSVVAGKPTVTRQPPAVID